MTINEWLDTYEDQLHAGMLDTARAASQPVRIAAAILTKPDGGEATAFHTCEYGDGDGERSVKDFIRSVEHAGQLGEGEKLRFELWECVRV